MTTLADSLLDVLPQTQCTRCGYSDCAAYSQAMAAGIAAINQCPPGGTRGLALLAALTGQTTPVLNPLHGQETPRNVAWIDENWCIGCTLCINACPVDAIMGSNKLMHSVIEAYCTGCELCLPICPVDCIALENVTGKATGWDAWSLSLADLARSRYESNRCRHKQDVVQGNKSLSEKSAETHIADPKRNMIEVALQHARAKPKAIENTAHNSGIESLFFSASSRCCEHNICCLTNRVATLSQTNTNK